MENSFIIDNNDKGLSIKFKTEANIKLASVENEAERQYLKLQYQNCLTVIKAIEYTEPQQDEDINFILNTINTLWYKGIFSPLTLDNDEFEKAEYKEHYINKRYPSIYKSKVGLVYNKKAFDCYLRAIYNHKYSAQIQCASVILHDNRKIYISKGGIITGEFIEDCIIPPTIVVNHNYKVIEPFIIPICKIIDGDDFIFAVDHRCPQLKQLMKEYVVTVQIDTTVKEKHYNIRKYKKINKV